MFKFTHQKKIQIWQDAQHQDMDIAQRAAQQPVQHVVAATMAATIHTHPTPHPTSHREAAGACEAAWAVAAEA